VQVLLGVTGSVAAVKTPLLAEALRAAGHAVKVAPTEPALAFLRFEELEPAIGDTSPGPLVVRGQDTVYRDADEWPQDGLFTVGEPVLHIELRKWADLLVIAPLDANTLAKVALGLCDNLLTCVYRAWDLNRPIVLAPAMNTHMWQHPATVRHLRQLLADHGQEEAAGNLDAEALCAAINQRCPKLRVVPPVTKRLACGDEGIGGIGSVQAIVLAAKSMLVRKDAEVQNLRSTGL
jgi:phosphopantothenoylcysteine decarboxylase